MAARLILGYSRGSLFMKREISFLILYGVCFLTVFLCPFRVFSADDAPATVQPSNHLSFVEGEIIEVNGLKDALGSAVYKIRIYETGETMELFADRDRSLILAGEEIKEAPDILGGAKATIIYGEIKERDLPVIVFARITSTTSISSA